MRHPYDNKVALDKVQQQLKEHEIIECDHEWAKELERRERVRKAELQTMQRLNSVQVVDKEKLKKIEREEYLKERGPLVAKSEQKIRDMSKESHEKNKKIMDYRVQLLA